MLGQTYLYCYSDKEASYVPPFQLGQWEGHILSSLPFYMLLLPLLLELIRSRVSTQAAKALQDLAKVILVQATFTASLNAGGQYMHAS